MCWRRRCVTAARDRGLDLPTPECVREVPGAGIAGLVEGQASALGGPDFVGGGFPDEDGHAAGGQPRAGHGRGRAAGVLVLADPLREDAPAMLAAARGAGIRRVVLLSGDQAAWRRRSARRSARMRCWRSAARPRRSPPCCGKSPAARC